MFQLDQDEFDSLRSQIVISKGKGGRRYLPHAFTEQGVAILSSVLRSKRAIQLNVAIMPTFVKLREMIATHKYRDKLKLQKRASCTTFYPVKPGLGYRGHEACL